MKQSVAGEPVSVAKRSDVTSSRATSFGFAPGAGRVPLRLRRIEEIVQAHIARGDVTGGVVLVAQRGERLYHEAFGVARVRTRAQALDPESIFWSASMTKPVVAAAVLMLAEKRKLDLHDPVSHFIEAFRAPRQVRLFEPGVLDAAKSQPLREAPRHRLVIADRELTVLDLLTHTAGLQSVGMPNEAIPAIRDGDTLATWVPKLAHAPLDFQPGTQWAYSNTVGFEVLAHIVELASGLPLDRFLRERLFEPLGMRDTGFGIGLARPGRAVPLDRRLAENPCVLGTTYFCGSGGLWTTAVDYSRFAQALAQSGELDGRRVLGRESVELLASDHTQGLFTGWRGIEGRGAQMGLSVLVVLDSAAAGVALPPGSYGWDGFGNRRFWVVPEADAVIVMMMLGGNAVPVHRQIETAAIEAIAA